MKRREKTRLMKKYKIKSCGYGMYQNAFFEGLKAAETAPERKPIKDDDIQL